MTHGPRWNAPSVHGGQQLRLTRIGAATTAAIAITGGGTITTVIDRSREAGTVVLDARSRELYDRLHVKGAVNLSFPDIALDSLAKVLPDRNARLKTADCRVVPLDPAHG